MRKAAIFLSLFLAALVPGGLCRAQESGAFLKLPVSPRAGGLGDAYAALADDVFGLYYNPAGMAFMKHPSASFVYHQYLQEISGNSFGFVYPLKNWAIGIAPTIYAMKKEPVYDWLGADTGERIGYEARIIPLALAGRKGNFAVGAAGKYYSEDIGAQTSATFAYDVGALYRSGGASFGASLHNLGGRIFGYNVPNVRRAGAAYLPAGQAGTGGRYSMAADWKKEGEDKGSFGLGGTFFLEESLGVSGGWRFKDEFGGMTFGLSMKFGVLNFDYAYLSYGDLGTTNKAGISLVFGADARGPAKPKKKVEAPKPAESVRLSSGTSLAVADFSGRHVPRENAIMVADYLRTRLAETGRVKVMGRDLMDNLLADYKARGSGCAEQKCAVELGKLLHVEKMLVGTLSKLASTYFVEVSVVDVETGKITASYDGDAASSEELRNACKNIAEKMTRP